MSHKLHRKVENEKVQVQSSKNRWLSKKVATISLVAGILLIATAGSLLYFNNLPKKTVQAATPFDSITSASIAVNGTTGAVVGSTIGNVVISNLPTTGVTNCGIVATGAGRLATQSAVNAVYNAAGTCTLALNTAQVGTDLKDSVVSLDLLQITLGITKTVAPTTEFRTFNISPSLPSKVGAIGQTTDTAYQFNKANISVLKADGTNAQDQILHKEWRTGVNTADMKIVVDGFQPAQNLLATSALPAGTYKCNITVAPSAQTLVPVNLLNDTNGNGLIDTTTTPSEGLPTNTDIPYIPATGCSVPFTSFTRIGGGGQTNITSTLSKNYQWNIEVKIKDSANNIVDTETSFYEFKFAGVQLGG